MLLTQYALFGDQKTFDNKIYALDGIIDFLINAGSLTTLKLLNFGAYEFRTKQV